MPSGLLILPFELAVFCGFLYLAFYLGKYKDISQKKLFIVFWSVQAVLELIYIIAFVDGVQFLPPSIFVSYAYGTLFFILYSVQCLFSKNPPGKKLKYIGASAGINYLVIPLLFIYIG